MAKTMGWWWGGGGFREEHVENYSNWTLCVILFFDRIPVQLWEGLSKDPFGGFFNLERRISPNFAKIRSVQFKLLPYTASHLIRPSD